MTINPDLLASLRAEASTQKEHLKAARDAILALTDLAKGMSRSDVLGVVVRETPADAPTALAALWTLVDERQLDVTREGNVQRVA